MTHRHTIHQSHLGWDNSLRAVARIAPGETLEFDVSDSSASQLSPASSVADVGRLDFSRINPVSGPVFIEGARAGDVLKVTLLSFEPSGWGWTANIPGFGLLADEFKEPALHLWKYDAKTLAPAMFGRWGLVPLKPFTGTIGWRPLNPENTASCRRVGSAATWMCATSRWVLSCFCRSKSRERCSQWATRMRHRGMAKCAAPPSRARCGWRSNSI